MRTAWRCSGVGLTARGPRPDAILHFRHLLEPPWARCCWRRSPGICGAGPAAAGGTIVDATILDAPASTKNRAQQRDPEMHQVKQGNQWYFGMKAHIGVDAATGLPHSVVTTRPRALDRRAPLRPLPDIRTRGDSRMGSRHHLRAICAPRGAARRSSHRPTPARSAPRPLEGRSSPRRRETIISGRSREETGEEFWRRGRASRSARRRGSRSSQDEPEGGRRSRGRRRTPRARRTRQDEPCNDC